MRIFLIHDGLQELPDLPAELPAAGYLWIGSARREFEVRSTEMQAALHRWGVGTIVDLHLSDLLNHQLPSHFDYTSWYDLMVFRRLAAPPGNGAMEEPVNVGLSNHAIAQVDTSPVGFAVFDRLLITVHPADCQVREFFIERLRQMTQASGASSRMPAGPADLMLRIVNHMVDGYLDLRRLLTRQLGQLQAELLGPHGRRVNWQALLESRNALHLLEDICEDQRSAVQEWLDAMQEWPAEAGAHAARERELLRLRSRDVLEHIERVLSHVRRLESSAESAVQMHFSAVGQRTNDIMRTLTVLTAIFLPLNLITGFFGMNFDFLPLIHSALGFWVAVVAMLAVGLGLAAFFWRKRYLGTRH